MRSASQLGTQSATQSGSGGAPAPPPHTKSQNSGHVAPHEHDVWSHRQLLKVVSHTPIECEKLIAAQNAGGWIDVMRRFVPASEKLYTWWSYRALDWEASDRGRRLDHVWASPVLADRVTGMTVARAARGWTRPSDHVPVFASFDL